MTPKILPLPTVVECSIDLDYGTEHAVHNRGQAATVSKVREAIWTGRFETAPLATPDLIRWQAWHKTLRGGLNLFVAHDELRKLPQAYWQAGQLPGGWDGVANVADLSLPYEIALTGVPGGYEARTGDRIGLEQQINGQQFYGYHEIVADTVATGGGAITLTVEPQVSSAFTTAATARLLAPLCQFRIVKGSFSAPTRGGFNPVRFEAVQQL